MKIADIKMIDEPVAPKMNKPAHTTRTSAVRANAKGSLTDRKKQKVRDMSGDSNFFSNKSNARVVATASPTINIKVNAIAAMIQTSHCCPNTSTDGNGRE